MTVHILVPDMISMLLAANPAEDTREASNQIETVDIAVLTVKIEIVDIAVLTVKIETVDIAVLTVKI